jgi:hypothetical protein
MLLNELHQGGIRALLAWEPTIFDNMTLPEGVTLEDVVDRIIYKYGDTPLFTPDPEIVKFYTSRWSARRLPLWERYKAAIELEYDPIENYDRHELTTRKPNLTRTQGGGYTDNHTGTVTNANTGDTTDQRAADNSSAWENYDKTNVNLTDTATNNLTDTRTFNNMTEAETGTDTTESRIHGNIGVTTSQQMLTSELDLIPRLDLIDYIADDWHSEFCLLIY